MATDVTGEAAARPPAPMIQPLPPESEASGGPGRDARTPRVYRARFGLAYLILAAFVGAAVGLLVVFVADRGGSSEPAWSAWKPQMDGVQGRAEIARRVGGGYGLIDGSQLVSVLSGPPEVQQVPVRAIVVRTGLAGETQSDLQIYDASRAWTYILCGDGANCAISQGKPSVARGRLPRREALELALYTFKYTAGVDSVLTFMPPPAGQQAKAVIFLRKNELKVPLTKPLAQTLRPQSQRLVPGGLKPADLAALRQYADPRTYNFEYQQIPDGSAIIVLSPLS